MGEGDSPLRGALRQRWQVRMALCGDVCGVKPGGRVPLRGCGGGFGKCCVSACILCVLRAGWKGWCTQPGEGWALAPPPPFLKEMFGNVNRVVFREMTFSYGSNTTSVGSEKFKAESVYGWGWPGGSNVGESTTTRSPNTHLPLSVKWEMPGLGPWNPFPEL